MPSLSAPCCRSAPASLAKVAPSTVASPGHGSPSSLAPLRRALPRTSPGVSLRVAPRGPLRPRATTDAFQGQPGAGPVIDVVASPTPEPTPAQRLLGGITLISAATGQEVEALSLWDSSPGSSSVALLCFLTHFGDLTTAEYAQLMLRKILPAIEASAAASPAAQAGAPPPPKVTVAAVGLGSLANARKWAGLVDFPLDLLYCDPDGAAYSQLEFSKGFAPEVPVNPYLKLLPMLAGIGSPGTIQEVLRGYVGDRDRSPIFGGSTPFDVLGSGYQRPFELATQRLFNMGTVLSNWSQLAPKQENLLTQQGGTIIFKGGSDVFFHKDSGILMYANVDDVLSTLEKVDSP